MGRSATGASRPRSGSTLATAQWVVPRSMPTMANRYSSRCGLTFSSSFQRPSPPASRHRSSRTPSSVTAAWRFTGARPPGAAPLDAGNVVDEGAGRVVAEDRGGEEPEAGGLADDQAELLRRDVRLGPLLHPERG